MMMRYVRHRYARHRYVLVILQWMFAVMLSSLVAVRTARSAARSSASCALLRL